MKKKWLIGLMALSMSFATIGFTGCVGGENPDDGDGAQTEQPNNGGNTGGTTDGGNTGGGTSTPENPEKPEQGGEGGTITPEKPDVHTCVFDQEVVEAEYKASDATCTAKETYYYSCECGASNEGETFEYGDYAEHVYDQEVVTDEYKASDASCIEKATYYYSCACGLASEDETFEYGDYAEHVYNQEVVTDEYKASDASCIEKATYYYACECGKKGIETYEEGELNAHNVVDGKCSICQITESKGLSYTLSQDNTYYSVSIGTCTDTIIIIPSEHEQLPIKSIEKEGFKGCSNLTSIILPDSITSIGKNAFFNCGALTDIIIPDSVTSIGEKAFYLCGSLMQITIPGSVTSIGNDAFSECYALTIFCERTSKPSGWRSSWNVSSCPIVWNCNNTDVASDKLVYTVVNGIRYTIDKENMVATVAAGRSVSYSLFVSGQASNIVTANIPTSIRYKDADYIVREIGANAFKNCNSLTTVVIPNSVTSIGNNAFEGCNKLLYTIEGACKYLVFNENPYFYLTEIIDKTITSVTVNENCQFIKSGVFNGCANLESMTLPFVGLSKTEDKGYYQVFGAIFLINKSTKENNADSNTSPGYIGVYQYYDDTNVVNPNHKYYHYYIPVKLKEITITGGDIPFSAFKNCSTLERITMPNILESIDSYAFYNCSGLQEIVIPEGVTNIGDYAFYNCSGAQEIVIPEGITNIGDYAFDGCNIQYNVEGNCKYWGNKDNPYMYLVATTSKAITAATINDGCKIINKRAFLDCSALEEIVIPDSVINIDVGAFEGCTNLKSVTFGANSELQTIGDNAFYFCSSLMEIIIPNSVIKIGASAFSNSGLNSVSLSDNIESIDTRVFENCGSLTRIVIPDNVTNIGTNAFSGCDSLSCVMFGEGSQLTRIESYAFAHCGLQEIVVPDSVTSIDKGAFLGCNVLEDIMLPFIGGNVSDKKWHFGYIFGADYYYQNGSNVPASLKTVTLTSESSISNQAFYSCKNLMRIVIPESVINIGVDSFESCDNLTIYCEVESQPTNWRNSWNNYRPIVWNCNANDVADDGYTYIIQDGVHYRAKGENAELYRQSDDITSISIPETIIYKDISYNVTGILDYAFDGCKKLTGIIIPNTITYIGSMAFNDCDDLTEMYIPKSVTHIGYSAFRDCDNIQSIICGASSKPSGWHSEWAIKDFQNYKTIYHWVFWGH